MKTFKATWTITTPEAVFEPGEYIRIEDYRAAVDRHHAEVLLIQGAVEKAQAFAEKLIAKQHAIITELRNQRNEIALDWYESEGVKVDIGFLDQRISEIMEDGRVQ